MCVHFFNVQSCVRNELDTKQIQLDFVNNGIQFMCRCRYTCMEEMREKRLSFGATGIKKMRYHTISFCTSGATSMYRVYIMHNNILYQLKEDAHTLLPLTMNSSLCLLPETLYHRDDALLYIAYVMLIWAAPIPADRWHCSLWPKITPWVDWHAS